MVDLATAQAARLRHDGASEAGARRLAGAIFPSSMSDAIAWAMRSCVPQPADRDAGDDATFAFEDVRWAPALDPPVIRDSMTFPVHMKQIAKLVGPPNPQFFKTPGFFKGSTATVYGHEAEIPYPSIGEQIDYELEIGIVVGRPGRNLTPEQAEACLFGLTIFNDFSIRDVQGREMGMGMGPQHAQGLRLRHRPVDHDDRRAPADPGARSSRARSTASSGRSAIPTGMFWTPAELLAYVSIADGLQPGDIIGSGTVGHGSGAELGRFLKPGDVVELTVEGIGTLRNTFTATIEQYPWWPEQKPNPFETEAAV